MPFSALNFLDFSRWGGSRAERAVGRARQRVRRRLNGEWIDDKAPPPGPALQGLGRVTMLGWVSILVAALAALAVGLAATGTLSAAAFSGLTMFALAMAAVLLAATAFSLVRIGRASRR